MLTLLRPGQGERWIQRSTMNGFLELESLESLNGRLSKTETWYEIFQQLAEQAARLDAVGNGIEAEMFYQQCKLYLEEASEGDKDVAGSSNLPMALCWVYLALANLYRYSLMPDYSKATEYFFLLLSTRAEVVSSSEGMVAPSYNEIRFAYCLTSFEWVDVFDKNQESDQAADMAVLNALPLEEARGIVDEWKTLDDLEVASSLAYMLSLGYAKLQRNDKKSYWDQWLTKKRKFFLQRISEFPAKAAAAKAAGRIFAEEQCYRQCEAAVRAAGDEFPISARLETLEWAYENLARIYRLDRVDYSEAIECYRASLSAIQVHTGLDSTIRGLNFCIIEVMYERAYDADTLLDVERQAQLVAVARAEARKLIPEVFDGSMSDLDVGAYICSLLSTRYERWGRAAAALFWNDERLKLMDKTNPSYDGIYLRSFGLLRNLGEHEKAHKLGNHVLKRLKKSLPQESPDALKSPAALERILVNPECGVSGTDVIVQEYIAAVESAEQIFKRSKSNDDTNHEKTDQITKWISEGFEGEQLLIKIEEWGNEIVQQMSDAEELMSEIDQQFDEFELRMTQGQQCMSEDKLDEALACLHKGLGLLSADGDDDKKMRCHGQIGVCHELLLFKAFNSDIPCGVRAYPDRNMEHFRLSQDNLQSALKVAEQRDDIYKMAYYNRVLGALLFKGCRFVHDKHSEDGSCNCLRTALNHFKTSGQNLNKFLYGLRDTNELWISVLERHDGMSVYYLTQRLIHEVIHEEIRNQEIEPSEYTQCYMDWSLQALLWAERGHSRSLAFKLTERNMGPSTRSELQRFDMDDWGEASASILESRDVSGPGTVMLEFFKSSEQEGEKFIIYYVTPDGEVGMQLSYKPEKDLKILLKNLHDHMSQDPESDLSDQELMQSLEDLYEAFFSPIQPTLDAMEEDHKLVICANKILAGVPFAALRNPETKKFLIERHTVVCTPSLRILKQCDERLKTLQSLPLMEGTRAALVLGDPAFSFPGDRLIDSGKEANTVADILGRPNVHLLKGKSALKKDVLEWAQRATGSGKYQALMHLATHGKGADDDFKEGALQFADPKVKAWPPVPTPRDSHDRSNLRESQIKTSDETSSSTSSTSLKAQEEEFVYCGRGHTGPRRGELDPCHLTSEEIVKDHEWRMLLVVLSACETARGEVKSEGTFNLARALLISGVPSTVVSQWKVDDASAPTLMEGMYKAMKKDDLDVASALRASMLDMIKNGYWIHQWAPFVVMGLGTVKLPKTFLETKKNLISSV